MSLIHELKLLKSAASHKLRYLVDKRIAEEWDYLICYLKANPLDTIVIVQEANAERAKNEGLTVRYCGDIIPQWEVSIPDEGDAHDL